ncbi:MAG: alpha-ketoacid dehydrogenase subunit beta, partial [Brachybacterium tyrofermentans]
MSSTTLPIAKAITAGLRDAMRADDKVLLMGEDIGVLGGVFRVTDGLHSEFGSQRVVDTPLAEAGIVGTSVGLAVRGYRPVVEIQFDGFVFPAFNQITTQVAKMHNRTNGAVHMPIVIRIPHGGGIGAIEHHSESPEALFAHTAGLRILAPSNAHDAYWMTRQAIECEDPVILFEPKKRYWVKGDVDPDQRPELSPWQAEVVRPGTDATLLAWGPSMPLAIESAEAAAEDGIELEVIDARSLAPIDYP